MTRVKSTPAQHCVKRTSPSRNVIGTQTKLVFSSQDAIVTRQKLKFMAERDLQSYRMHAKAPPRLSSIKPSSLLFWIQNIGHLNGVG